MNCKIGKKMSKFRSGNNKYDRIKESFLPGTLEISFGQTVFVVTTSGLIDGMSSKRVPIFLTMVTESDADENKDGAPKVEINKLYFSAAFCALEFSDNCEKAACFSGNEPIRVSFAPLTVAKIVDSRINSIPFIFGTVVIFKKTAKIK